MEHRCDDFSAGALCSSSSNVTGPRPLRLETTYWIGPLLCTPVPETWILDFANIAGMLHNFKLVMERIIDACFHVLPDCPHRECPRADLD